MEKLYYKFCQKVNLSNLKTMNGSTSPLIELLVGNTGLPPLFLFGG